MLIEQAPEKFVIIECKTAAQVDVSALRPVRSLRGEYGEASVTKAFVACRTERAYPLIEADWGRPFHSQAAAAC